MYYSSNTNFSCHCTQLHQNHWGTEKTKYMLYELFWLPNTNKDVEDLVKRWLFYQVVTPLSQFETTKPHIHATTPLGHLHTYLCGPFSAGEYIFTFIDAYSRYSWDCTSKGHVIENINKGIRVDIFQTWLPIAPKDQQWSKPYFCRIGKLLTIDRYASQKISKLLAKK